MQWGLQGRGHEILGGCMFGLKYRFNILILFVFLIGVFTASTTFATTWHVPADFDSVCTAIDAALDGGNIHTGAHHDHLDPVCLVNFPAQLFFPYLLEHLSPVHPGHGHIQGDKIKELSLF